MAQRPLRMVVRRLDALDSDERPQVRLARQQLPACPSRPGAETGRTPAQVLPEAIPQPRHIEPEARPGQCPIPHPMPPPEQHVGVLQQPPADLARLAAPVDHRLEIPAEVRPTELAS